MNTKAQLQFENWFAIATKDINRFDKARIKSEFEAHFYDAGADASALESLGNPLEVNKELRKLYWTEAAMTITLEQDGKFKAWGLWVVVLYIYTIATHTTFGMTYSTMWGAASVGGVLPAVLSFVLRKHPQQYSKTKLYGGVLVGAIYFALLLLEAKTALTTFETHLGIEKAVGSFVVAVVACACLSLLAKKLFPKLSVVAPKQPIPFEALVEFNKKQKP